MFSKKQQLTSGSKHIEKPPIIAANKNLLLFSQPSHKELPNPASNSLNNSQSRISSFLFIGRWFRFGVVLFLLLSVLLGTAGCTASATTTISWTPATRLIPVETVRGIVAENSDLNPQNSASNVLAWAVNGQAGRLVIFNFNSPGVCGAGGCLYAGYLFRKNVPPNRVFASYLNENLPPNRPLIQVVSDPSKTSDLPCLQVQQPSQNGIRQLFYCFNGRQYQLANSSLIELPNKTVP